MVTAVPMPREDFVRQQLALQPAFNGATRLLGQVAGVLLLANAGSDLDRQRQHLNNARAQWRELDQIAGHLDQSMTGIGIVESIGRLGVLVDRLDRRFSASLGDDEDLRKMLEELAAIRALLQTASCPLHGLALVDFAGGCCAGVH